MASQKKAVCGICGKTENAAQMIPVEMVGPQLARWLDERHPDWRSTAYVCAKDLADARRARVENLLVRERGELSALDKTVVESIARQETLASDTEAEFWGQRSFGDRVADRVTGFGGSWTFIIWFAIVVVLWMIANSIAVLVSERFDPYPYILLNLVLSCIAALQAPFIMMSQRRQEAKDRLRAQSDYRINLKAEIEIRALHEKLDHLLLQQWERLTEIQQIQIELIEDLARKEHR